MILTARAAIATVAGAVAVILVPQALTVAVWVGVVALVCVVDCVLASSPRKVTIARTVDGSVRLGESTRSTLVVTNSSARRLKAVVRDAWPPSAGSTNAIHRVRIPAGEARRMRTSLTPSRRGDRHAGPVTVRTLGPLGLAGRQRNHEAPARLRVLPPFHSRRHLPSRLARLREMDGRSSVQVRGQGTEFDSLREYVIGDDVRDIDWRATARLADVLVRTWRPERDRRILIVVDSGRLSAARLSDEPRLDTQIEGVLLLAALASRAGDQVNVVAVDSQVRSRVTGQRGLTLMSSLANALATVDPNLVETNWPTVTKEVRSTLSQRSLVVLLTPVDVSTLSSGLLPAARRLARDHVVVVAYAEDPELEALRAARDTSLEVHEAAAAERAGLEHSAIEAELRKNRIEIVRSGPENLAPALADRYLALKAAGRL